MEGIAFPIPAYDPIALPGPLWLFKLLHLVTLLLHLVSMNVLVTYALLGAIAALRSGRGTTHDHYRQLYRDTVGSLPILVASTVTLGVAPLLFVQLLYGHLVYTGSIVMGWFWWLVVPMLITAYYTFYHLKFREDKDARVNKWLPWTAAIILIWISFVFSNNFNLSAQPERFAGMLLENTRGLQLNLADPSTFPRWLHMVLGAIAVGGVWLMWRGRAALAHDREYGRFKLELGYALFAYPTMVNIVVGFVFMMTLRRDVMLLLMGRGMIETLLWIGGLALAIAALGLFKRAVRKPESPALLSGTILIGATVAMMVLLRDLVRDAYLNNVFQVGELATQTIAGPIAVFLVTFVVGGWTLYWMMRKLWV